MARSKRRKHREQKEQERFYLLPGQGGKPYRRKQKIIILWSVVAAILVSLIMGIIMYFTNRHNFNGL